MTFRTLVVFALSCLCMPAQGTGRNFTEVPICFNYGCLSEARVRFSALFLDYVVGTLLEARDAADERARLARAVGLLYREAGRQSPINADRAGDYLDDGVFGKMDCIDHATSTTRLLKVLEARGALRYHTVKAQRRRTTFILFQHFSAVVEERVPEGDGSPGAQFVIDSWFGEHGEPAVVLPLADWLDGDGPNVQ